MAKTPAAHKPPKLPKSLGACVDLFHELREKRRAAGRSVDEMKKDETFVSNYLIDNIDKRQEGGAVGKAYKAIVTHDDVYQVEDWDKFYAHIKKTGEFDLLNRALNQAAVKERVSMQDRPTGKRGEGWKPKLPPGIKTFRATKLSVTKV